MTTPSLFCPPLPQDKQEVEPTFDLLKSMVAVGRAAPDNLNVPPLMVHAAHDAVVFGTALQKFVGGIYNTELPPTVALEAGGGGGSRAGSLYAIPPPQPPPPVFER